MQAHIVSLLSVPAQNERIRKARVRVTFSRIQERFFRISPALHSQHPDRMGAIAMPQFPRTQTSII